MQVNRMPQIGHFPKHPSVEARRQGGKEEVVSQEEAGQHVAGRRKHSAVLYTNSLQCCTLQTPLLLPALHVLSFGWAAWGGHSSLAACWCFPGRAFDTMLPLLESISGHEEADLSLTRPCESSESSGHDFPIGILSL